MSVSGRYKTASMFGRTCWPFCVGSSELIIISQSFMFDGLFETNTYPPCKISNKSSRFQHWKQIKNKFWFSKLYGVHVSRLPVLHPDRDQWKHFILDLFFS